MLYKLFKHEEFYELPVGYCKYGDKQCPKLIDLQEKQGKCSCHESKKESGGIPQTRTRCKTIIIDNLEKVVKPADCPLIEMGSDLDKNVSDTVIDRLGILLQEIEGQIVFCLFKKDEDPTAFKYQQELEHAIAEMGIVEKLVTEITANSFNGKGPFSYD